MGKSATSGTRSAASVEQPSAIQGGDSGGETQQGTSIASPGAVHEVLQQPTERRSATPNSPPEGQDSHPAPPQGSAVLALLDKALTMRADAETMERLLAMQERLQAREDLLAYNAAKSRILEKLAGIKIVKTRSVAYELKDVKGAKTGALGEAFRYAALEDIDKELRPLLVAEKMDLSYSDEPQPAGAPIMVRGRLRHLPGEHYEDSFMAAPMDASGGKNNVQGVGSTNSYLRRYIACNIFNLVVVGDDDDGRGGSISDEQIKNILNKLKDAGLGGVRFLKYVKAAQTIEQAGSLEAAVATIPASMYSRADSVLDEQIAKRRQTQ